MLMGFLQDMFGFAEQFDTADALNACSSFAGSVFSGTLPDDRS